MLADAGNIIAKVQSKEAVKIVTIRPTAFDKASSEGGSAEVEEFAPVEGEGASLFPSPSALVSASSLTIFVSGRNSNRDHQVCLDDRDDV
jgi:electron transfer flavoprotein alpha subunit